MLVYDVGNGERKEWRKKSLNGRNHIVKFLHPDTTSDKAAWMAVVRTVFKNVLSVQLDFFLQIKDED